MHIVRKLQNYSYAQRCLGSCSYANHVLKMPTTAAAADGCHPGSMEARLGEKWSDFSLAIFSKNDLEIIGTLR